jgi:hypothetical protein
VCNEGVTLTWTHAVTDNDECATSALNSCEQLCVNRDGFFTCDCRPGYRLNADGETCRGTAGVVMGRWGLGGFREVGWEGGESENDVCDS